MADKILFEKSDPTPRSPDSYPNDLSAYDFKAHSDSAADPVASFVPWKERKQSERKQALL